MFSFCVSFVWATLVRESKGTGREKKGGRKGRGVGVKIGNVERAKQPKVFLGELASNFSLSVFIYCFISAEQGCIRDPPFECLCCNVFADNGWIGGGTKGNVALPNQLQLIVTPLSCTSGNDFSPNSANLYMYNGIVMHLNTRNDRIK